MSITNPKLLPKNGYVEIEDDGEHKYSPLPETLEKEKYVKLVNSLLLALLSE